METITITPKNKAQRTQILNYLKSLNISVAPAKDDTKMTKEEFFAKIDRARSQKGHRFTIEEFRAKYL